MVFDLNRKRLTVLAVSIIGSLGDLAAKKILVSAIINA